MCLGHLSAHVQIHIEWHPVSGLKLAMVEKFTAQTPANTINRCSFLFPKGLVVSHLPALPGLNLKSHSPLGWEGGIPLPQALVTYMPLYFHSFIHSLSKCLLINCHVIGPVCRRQPLFFSRQLFSGKNVGLVLLDLIFFFLRETAHSDFCVEWPDFSMGATKGLKVYTTAWAKVNTSLSCVCHGGHRFVTAALTLTEVCAIKALVSPVFYSHQSCCS